MSDYMPEGNSQGDSGESSSAEGSLSTDSTAESTGGGQTGFNPSWNEAFDAIPIPEYHEKLKPVFKKWDENNNQRYEQVQQEFAPYKILADNKVSIDDVRSAFELRNQFTQSPQEVFNRLAQHLNIDISKLNGGDESQGLDDPDEDDDPRFAELKELRTQQAGIRDYLVQQAEYEAEQTAQRNQEIQETNWYNETKDTLDSLQTKYGEFDRNRAVQFAVWEAEKTGGDVDLEKGLIAMKEFAGQAIKSSANATAPTVFSGNGSLVSGRVDTSKMNESEFQKYAVERIRAKNGG